MRPSRVLRGLFVAYVAATAVHIGLVMAHEPFSFDAWNLAADTAGQPFSFARFFDYGIFEYTHSNPRLGQWLTYLAYKLDGFAPIVTPLAYLGLALAVTTLGLGRWPGGRRRGVGLTAVGAGELRTVGRDLALASLAIGFAWFALPRIGMIMFCRAYGANYLYGAAIQLGFLIPLRLRAPDAPASVPACIAYGVLGGVAGMCNEHTGPALIAGLVAYAAWLHRASAPRPRLLWAGTLGALIGFAAIFFAPGQASRYDGLATKVSLAGRLVQRGVTGNLDIFRDWLIGCAPVLGLLVIAVIVARGDVRQGADVRRQPRGEAPAAGAGDAPVVAGDATGAVVWSLAEPLRLFGLALLAGSLVTATVFVSPKLGPRFYLHGAALVLAGLLAVADRALTTPRRLTPFVVLAVAASVYAGVRTLPLYDRLAAAGAERMATLAAAAPGDVVTVEAFEQVDDSWWFLGDDFRDLKKRELVASYLDLGGVVLRAVDIDAPLGVSDVQLVPRYQVTPASCLDAHGGVDLGLGGGVVVRGIDITAVHKALRAAIDRLRDRLAHATPAGRLDRLDVVVDFAGTPPPLPRPTLVVGRWSPAGLETHAGAIERKPGSTTRAIKLPPELAGTDYEVYAYLVSGEARRLGSARDRVLEYVPWKHGAYWALACHPTECFVIAAARVL